MVFPISQFEKDQKILTSLYPKISVCDQGRKASFSPDNGLDLLLANGELVTIPREECSPHVVAVILERVRLGVYSVTKQLLEDPTLTAYCVTVAGKRNPQRFTTISQRLNKEA
ncbi:MAG TPA: hypothetical protein VJ841_01480 [Candidatus Saccharimonadales bacterium]|nr:hypothetical protein [Candidatus Saccharimonadales bacterium]